MLAYPWLLLLGLQAQGQSREVFRDPYRDKGGTSEMDEEGLSGGIGVRAAA